MDKDIKELKEIKSAIGGLKIANVAVALLLIGLVLMISGCSVNDIPFVEKLLSDRSPVSGGKPVIAPLNQTNGMDELQKLREDKTQFIFVRNQTIWRGIKAIPLDPTTTITKEAGTLMIDEAYIDRPGFIVVHQKIGKQIKDVLGMSKIFNGTAKNIMIDIVNYDGYGMNLSKTNTKITQPLVAILYYDNNRNGQFNFPGADGPVFIQTNSSMKSNNTIQGKLAYKVFSIAIN